MALPKITAPTYKMIRPSTGEEIEYRPFLVGEEKILLMASETEDPRQISNAVLKLVHSCTYGSIGDKNDPMFDIEYAFLKIRGKSVAETMEINLICQDDGKTEVPYEINTDNIEILVDENHSKEIKLNDDFTLIMRYPTAQDSINVSGMSGVTETSFTIAQNCIETIIHGEESYNKVDLSKKELQEFFESLTQEMFQKVQDFFDTMPKLRHEVEIENPNTKVKSTVVLEGLASFLG